MSAGRKENKNKAIPPRVRFVPPAEATEEGEQKEEEDAACMYDGMHLMQRDAQGMSCLGIYRGGKDTWKPVVTGQQAA